MLSRIAFRLQFRVTPLRIKIYRLALPITFSMFTYTGVMVSDTLMLAPLGAPALAVGGLGGMILWTVLAFFLGSSTGVQIIIARRYGEKNYQAAANVFVLSLVLACILSLFATFILYFLAPYLVPFLSDGREFTPAAVSFVQIRIIGLSFYFLIFITRALFDGIGKTHLSFISSFVSMCSNILLNWLLIYGNWGFKAYGSDGAAAASSLAAIPGLFTALAFLAKKEYRIFLRYKEAQPLTLIPSILRVSLPSALDSCLMNLSFSIFYKLAALIGTVSVAATNILVSLLSVSFMPGFGFAIAATSLLGQAAALKKYQRAYYGVLCTAAYSARIMGTIGFFLIVFAEAALGIFANGEQSVIREAYPALIVIALVQIADAYQMTLGAALRSAGLVFWVLAVYALSSFFLMLPLAYILGVLLDWRTWGLWLGVAFWLSSLWLIFHYKFKHKSWEGHQV